MSIKWLNNHWFLLAFVFATGSAAAWQEVQRQTLEDVIIDQKSIQSEQHLTAKAIIRIEEQVKSAKEKQNEMSGDIKELIRLQMKMQERR